MGPNHRLPMKFGSYRTKILNAVYSSGVKPQDFMHFISILNKMQMWCEYNPANAVLGGGGWRPTKQWIIVGERAFLLIRPERQLLFSAEPAFPYTNSKIRTDRELKYILSRCWSDKRYSLLLSSLSTINRDVRPQRKSSWRLSASKTRRWEALGKW